MCKLLQVMNYYTKCQHKQPEPDGEVSQLFPFSLLSLSTTCKDQMRGSLLQIQSHAPTGLRSAILHSEMLATSSIPSSNHASHRWLLSGLCPRRPDLNALRQPYSEIVLEVYTVCDSLLA